MHLLPKSTLTLAMAQVFLSSFAYADDTTAPQQLETIHVTATDEKPKAYAATQAKDVLRSDRPLFETAQSISVITAQQLQQKQAQTLSDALEGVAGVTSGQYGRRGWDDFIIRGQVSSAQTYMDGLRIQTSDNVLRAEDIYGVDSIQVVKGPTSVGFGFALPGGLVNLTSKRPQAKTFYHAGLSYGSYALKDGTFDINYAPNQSEKGAMRLVGHVSDQDDPTDYVYFKNYYISPSYNFDLGDKDDLSVIFSYHHQEYIRQQGLPYSNGAYKNYSSKLFFGEPDKNNNVDTYRFGANYAHYFDNGWTFKQNFAVTKTDADNHSVLAASGATLPSIKRAINNQDKQDLNFALDNNVQRTFKFKNVDYDLMLGVDMMHERSNYWRRNDTINAFDATNPSYDITSLKIGSPTKELTYTQYMGAYIRNTFTINDRWILNLAGREDWTQVRIDNILKSTSEQNSDHAFTGNASLMYKINDSFAPYISYATSFFPVSDSGANGELLNPEKGKQAEIGMKFQGLDQRLQGYVAYYDLTRQNVTESDSSLGYSFQIGEQRTKGYETELNAALTQQWNVTATYSYIPFAKTTESLTSSDIGKRINHVPKNAASLSTQYYFNLDHTGWYLGASVNYQGDRSAQRGSYYVPLASYTLYNVNVGYDAKRWGAGFTVKNLFDKEYLVGTSPNAQLVNWGDPRTFRFNVNFKF